MNNYKLIIENLQYLEQFQSLYPNGDLKAYSLWLSDKMLQTRKTVQLENEADTAHTHANTEEFPEIEISTLITNLYRFARGYLKKALENTVFRTVDEFSFLSSLIKHENMLKSELIQEHLMEISSGTEVIKRLKKMDLIKEWPDPHDGRAKRVSLTIKGRNAIVEAFEDMHKVAKIMNGNLSLEEQKRIIIILSKLKNFHNNIFEKEKDKNLDIILKNYIK